MGKLAISILKKIILGKTGIVRVDFDAKTNLFEK